MDTPDLMDAIAQRLRLIPALAGVSYPPENTVPKSPWVMVRQSRTQPTVYKREVGRKMRVLPFIEIVILVTAQGDAQGYEATPREQSKIDGLIAQVLDALDPIVEGGSVNAMMPTLPGHVDRIWSEAPVQRLPLMWGPSGFCYAAVITLDGKFYRTSEPLEITP